MLTENKFVGKMREVTRSIVAGCGQATHMARCYLYELAEEAHLVHDNTFSQYVDDIVQRVRAYTSWELVHAAAKGP